MQIFDHHRLNLIIGKWRQSFVPWHFEPDDLCVSLRNLFLLSSWFAFGLVDALRFYALWTPGHLDKAFLQDSWKKTLAYLSVPCLFLGEIKPILSLDQTTRLSDSWSSQSSFGTGLGCYWVFDWDAHTQIPKLWSFSWTNPWSWRTLFSLCLVKMCTLIRCRLRK